MATHDDDYARYEIAGWMTLAALAISALISLGFIAVLIWATVKLVTHFTA